MSKESKPFDPKMGQETQELKNTLHQGMDDVKEKASDIYHQVKESAGGIYQEGKKTVCDAQHYLEDQTEEFIKIVKEKPLTSVLVAAGVGFVLAALLKK